MTYIRMYMQTLATESRHGPPSQAQAKKAVLSCLNFPLVFFAVGPVRRAEKAPSYSIVVYPWEK